MRIDTVKTALDVKFQQMLILLLSPLIAIILIELVDVRILLVAEEGLHILILTEIDLQLIRLFAQQRTMESVLVIEIACHLIGVTYGEVALSTHIQQRILIAVIEAHHLYLIQWMND